MWNKWDLQKSEYWVTDNAWNHKKANLKVKENTGNSTLPKIESTDEKHFLAVCSIFYAVVANIK
jgi:hypothetical protein